MACDGHHSLIRWGLVVHGGIDGFSRLIVYLYCSSNNCASTVTQLFERACSLFGVPSRARSDRGGENTGVCEYMIRNRGTDRGSHIAGPSTHTIRGLKGCGGMSFDVFVQLFMVSSIIWKKWGNWIPRTCTTSMHYSQYFCHE